MPRMLVNLAPSRVQFNDGESPIVSGLAHLGETMAKLPLQQAQILMQQKRDQDEQDRFDADHQLRMGADARAAEEHDQRMKMNDQETKSKHREGVYKGYDDPAEGDEYETELHDRGAMHEQAQIDAANARTTAEHPGHYHLHGDRTNGLWKYDDRDGSVTRVEDQPAGAAGPQGPTPLEERIAHDNAIAAARAPEYAEPTIMSRLKNGVMERDGLSEDSGVPSMGAATNRAAIDGASTHFPGPQTAVTGAGAGTPPPMEDPLAAAFTAHDAGDPEPLRTLLAHNKHLIPQAKQHNEARKLMLATMPGQGTPFDMRMGQ